MRKGFLAFGALALALSSTFALAQGKPPAKSAAPAPRPPAVAANLPNPQLLTYESNGLTLKAFLYEPAGEGPFPVYFWNHGSEPEPNADRVVAQFWLGQGFAFYKPIRSGHGGNPGPYIVDAEKAARDQFKARKITRAALYNDEFALHQKANQDTIAAYRWLVAQPFVAKDRIVMGGGSYGGIQTLLAAEQNTVQNLGIACFVAMSPAAESWSPEWGTFLTKVVKGAKAPIFLMQAKNDYSLGPSTTLGPVIDAKGFPSRHKVFPVHVTPGGDPKDPTEGHGKFFLDPSAWSADVVKYLADCKAMPAQTAKPAPK